MAAKIPSDCFIPVVRNDSPLSVCGVLSIGRTKASELIKESETNGFPKPINLGGRCLRYRLSEVLEWAASKRVDSVPSEEQGAAA